MAKLPKGVRKIVEDTIQEQIPHLAWVIWAKESNYPNLASWFKDDSVEYYKGLLQGAYFKVESLLSAYNCYEGFQVVEQVMKDGKWSQTAPHNRYYYFPKD